MLFRVQNRVQNSLPFRRHTVKYGRFGKSKNVCKKRKCREKTVISVVFGFGNRFGPNDLLIRLSQVRALPGEGPDGFQILKKTQKATLSDFPNLILGQHGIPSSYWRAAPTILTLSLNVRAPTLYVRLISGLPYRFIAGLRFLHFFYFSFAKPLGIRT